MKPKITFGRYVIALLLTLTCVASLYAYQEQAKCESILQTVRLAHTTSQGHIDKLEQDNAELSAQISSLSAEISSLRQDMERKADKADRGGECVRYELSTDERKLVEQVVTAEARDEPYEGQILVCQCILNACENLDKRPADIIRIYKYAKVRPAPTDSVKQAVSAVFDKGEQVTDEPVIYFYAPALVESKFHEGKRFIIRVGCHRFFAEK